MSPIIRRKRIITHEDALRASRSIMRRALSEIAYYGKDEDNAALALKALREEHERYVALVRVSS